MVPSTLNGDTPLVVPDMDYGALDHVATGTQRLRGKRLEDLVLEYLDNE